jgi:hypothetical protein
MTPTTDRVTRANLDQLRRLGPLAEARAPQQLLVWNRQRQELSFIIDEIGQWLSWLSERAQRSRAQMARQHDQAREHLAAGREDACRLSLRRKCELRRLVALDRSSGAVLWPSSDSRNVPSSPVWVRRPGRPAARPGPGAPRGRWVALPGFTSWQWRALMEPWPDLVPRPAGQPGKASWS